MFPGEKVLGWSSGTSGKIQGIQILRQKNILQQRYCKPSRPFSTSSSRVRAWKETGAPGGPPQPPEAGSGGEGRDEGPSGRPYDDPEILTETSTSRAEDVIVLDVSGMHCGGCVSRVKRVLEEHPSVSQANVNLTTEVALVRVVLPTTTKARVPRNASDEQLLKIADQLIQVLASNGFKAGVRSRQQTNAAASAIVQSRREERISR